MTDKITLEQLKVYHGQVGDLWKAIKDGNREALFGLEVAWTDFSRLVQAVSDKYGDRSPEDYICGGLVEGMRRAIDRAEH